MQGSPGAGTSAGCPFLYFFPVVSNDAMLSYLRPGFLAPVVVFRFACHLDHPAPPRRLHTFELCPAVVPHLHVHTPTRKPTPMPEIRRLVLYDNGLPRFRSETTPAPSR